MAPTYSQHLHLANPPVPELRGAGVHVLAYGDFDWASGAGEGVFRTLMTVGSGGARSAMPLFVVFRPLSIDGTPSPVSVNVLVREGSTPRGNLIPNTTIKAFSALHEAFVLPCQGKIAFPLHDNWTIAFQHLAASTGTEYVVRVEVLGYLL